MKEAARIEQFNKGVTECNFHRNICRFGIVLSKGAKNGSFSVMGAELSICSSEVGCFPYNQMESVCCVDSGSDYMDHRRMATGLLIKVVCLIHVYIYL